MEIGLPSITVNGALNSNVQFTTGEAFGYAQNLGSLISAGLIDGSLSELTYSGGDTIAGPASGTGGVANFQDSTNPPTAIIAIPTSDSAIVDSLSGPLSITGGAAGETVLAGSGGLYYTDITPSGNAIDYIVAGDGNNSIASSMAGTGNYGINTGAGNDSISINGNAVINAGSGTNFVSVTGGSSYVYSEGADSITGSTVVGGGGTDTVNMGSGQTTVNPGTSNLFIFGTSTTTNPLTVLAGTGSDTISVGSGGGDVTAGSGGNSLLIGGAGATQAPLTLRGTTDGDRLYAISAGQVTAIAGAGNETISGAVSSPDGLMIPSTADNTFYAGSGNDTLIAGLGNDTMIGGTGTALMQSSTQGKTTFEFQFGSGGQDTITGFKPTDTLQFTGYGAAPLPTTEVGGSTVISLGDGTKITLSNVTQLNPTQVKLT